MPLPDSAAVNAMFGRIARRYDLANRLLSLGLDTGWRRRLVAAVGRASPRRVLDLATGSGDVAFALSRSLPAPVAIVGLDFCLPMLAEAERKKAGPGATRWDNVTFMVGDALNLPLADGSFDAATISFGLRNMSDRRRCLAEALRVLRPGGRLFVLEFSQPVRWARPGYYFYLGRILPVLAGWLTADRKAYLYLNQTIKEFPDADSLSDEIRAAGFAAVGSSRLACGVVALHEAEK